ncbi:ParB N-terminal domain-containing protein [Aureimonas sp. AU12]|uniref:ParB N-terminal domain-containing protein n=1 Tax=Aureimonas sp. AU12 TaxID=1638161 RepID=UPI000AF065F2|nr:ParB N-terminal domain-containing protein [Aureimonas sp. AU12]
MSSVPNVSATQDSMVPIQDLRFDPQNPRVPTEVFQTEEDSIRYLTTEYDVEELVQSILSSGWIDYEPLIVQKNTNIVFEGNRRLAAIRLISDAKLRSDISYKLPNIDNPQPLPADVRVRFVDDRADARRFIAFKHINGPFKWDAYAKAKYAAEWLNEGADVDVVSKMLGDNHNTIRRLVAGYRVLEQAQNDNVFNINDRTKKRFAFSHLYTAISRPSVRSYLGIEDDEDTKTPVPKENTEQLKQVMSWLYGQESKKEPTVIASQNPNLNQLVRVIENKTALGVLASTRRLDQAFEQVEPPSERFKEALIGASKECEGALGLSSHYDGDETLLSMVRNLATTVRNLRDNMLKKSLGDEDI